MAEDVCRHQNGMQGAATRQWEGLEKQKVIRKAGTRLRAERRRETKICKRGLEQLQIYQVIKMRDVVQLLSFEITW